MKIIELRVEERELRSSLRRLPSAYLRLLRSHRRSQKEDAFMGRLSTNLGPARGSSAGPSPSKGRRLSYRGFAAEYKLRAAYFLLRRTSTPHFSLLTPNYSGLRPYSTRSRPRSRSIQKRCSPWKVLIIQKKTMAPWSAGSVPITAGFRRPGGAGAGPGGMTMAS